MFQEGLQSTLLITKANFKLTFFVPEFLFNIVTDYMVRQ